MTQAFLRLPPFPGQRGRALSQPGRSIIRADAVLDALRREQVGGSFWAAPVDLVPGCALVLVPDDADQLTAMMRAAQGEAFTVSLPPGLPRPQGAAMLPRSFDPWHVARQASAVWAGSQTELATVAALLGKPVRLFAKDGTDEAPDPAARLIEALLRDLSAQAWTSPFTGADWTIDQTITQLGEWRRLIEGNRAFRAIFGVARWKRVTLDPLLWDGTGPVRHARRIPADLGPGAQVLAWQARTAPAVLAELRARQVEIAELEDGFIRSVGLGANCVPPLSVIVDRSGIYFDPAGPSDLENLLEQADLPASWLERAAALRAALVQQGISKYGQGKGPATPTARPGRTVLVTGQVEDDRSVLSGGKGCTNLDLIIRARRIEPDARIVYKPHPDVEAGHRRGHVPDAIALEHADVIERHAAITALLDQADALHVITSLAGFEALLRGKPVTTHGQPFYAGWGLTRDLAPPNPRRTRRRSLDELVAATLIGYPRYVDPVTRLPCPPEVVVARIAAGQARVTSPLVALREWQGRLRRWGQQWRGSRR